MEHLEYRNRWVHSEQLECKNIRKTANSGNVQNSWNTGNSGNTGYWYNTGWYTFVF